MHPYQPETFQYYFERYLRNKLSADEKTDFEGRLAKDQELQKLLENYKLNRKKFLKDLLKENGSSKPKSKIAPFIYLTITMAGIILATNFYYENLLLKEERLRDKNLITRLIAYIPFIGNANQSDTSTKNVETKLKLDSQSKNTTTHHQSQHKETKLAENKLVIDTFLIPVSRRFFEEKLQYYRTAVDSTLTFSDIKKLVINTFHKIDIKHKSKPVKIEYWQTSNEEKIYKYDGITLLLHAPQPPTDLFFVTDESELIWLNNDAEIILITDNQPHHY